MTTKRTPRSRGPKAQITPGAIEAFRRMRAWEGRCTCPLPPAWIPGQNVFTSSDPVCVERQERANRAWADCEAERAKCPACPTIALEEKALLEELRVKLRPWQRGMDDFPALVEALEAAIDAPEPPENGGVGIVEAVNDGTIKKE